MNYLEHLIVTTIQIVCCIQTFMIILKYYKHGYSKVTDHVLEKFGLSGLLKNLEEKSLIIFHHKTLLMLKYFVGGLVLMKNHFN